MLRIGHAFVDRGLKKNEDFQQIKDMLEHIEIAGINSLEEARMIAQKIKEGEPFDEILRFMESKEKLSSSPVEDFAAASLMDLDRSSSPAGSDLDLIPNPHRNSRQVSDRRIAGYTDKSTSSPLVRNLSRTFPEYPAAWLAGNEGALEKSFQRGLIPRWKVRDLFITSSTESSYVKRLQDLSLTSQRG